MIFMADVCFLHSFFFCASVCFTQPLKITKSLNNLKLIFLSYTRLFLVFAKKIAGKIKKFRHIEKNTQTWFAGFQVFPCLDLTQDIWIHTILMRINQSSLSSLFYLFVILLNNFAKFSERVSTTIIIFLHFYQHLNFVYYTEV